MSFSLFGIPVDIQAEAVAAQFNAKIAAAISLEQLRQVWSSVEQQAGSFGEVIDEPVDIAQDFKDFTAVTLGCRFEKAVADFQIVFDAEKKIAGLWITPRRL